MMACYRDEDVFHVRMVYSPEMKDIFVHPSHCVGPIHPAAVKGMELFDAGEFWLAHEELEQAWKEESGPIGELYRAILQTAVVYLHVTRANYNGAIKVYGRVQKWIRHWPEVCRGIEIGQLRRDLDTVIAEVKRLGPDGLAGFDRSLLKPVRWT